MNINQSNQEPNTKDRGQVQDLASPTSSNKVDFELIKAIHHTRTLNNDKKSSEEDNQHIAVLDKCINASYSNENEEELVLVYRALENIDKNDNEVAPLYAEKALMKVIVNKANDPKTLQRVNTKISLSFDYRGDLTKDAICSYKLGESTHNVNLETTFKKHSKSELDGKNYYKIFIETQAKKLLQNSLDELLLSYQTTTNHLINTTTEMHQLKEKLAESREEIFFKDHEIGKSNEEKRNLKKQSEDARKREAKTNKQHQKELETLKAELRATSKENQGLKKQSVSDRKREAETNKQHQKELETLKAELEKISKKNQDLKKQNIQDKNESNEVGKQSPNETPFNIKAAREIFANGKLEGLHEGYHKGVQHQSYVSTSYVKEITDVGQRGAISAYEAGKQVGFESGLYNGQNSGYFQGYNQRVSEEQQQLSFSYSSSHYSQPYSASQSNEVSYSSTDTDQVEQAIQAVHKKNDSEETKKDKAGFVQRLTSSRENNPTGRRNSF
jgi:hypothetical protein